MISSTLITEHYFNDIVGAAQKIRAFVNNLVADDEFCKIMDETIDTGGVDISNGDGPYGTARAFLLTDMIHAYMMTGHLLNDNSIDAAGFIIFSMCFLSRESEEIRYEHLQVYWKNAGEKAMDYLHGEQTYVFKHPDLFHLEKCLKRYDVERHNQYVLYIYHSISALLKAGNQVSQMEVEKLNLILKLKIGIKPKDETNVESKEEENNDMNMVSNPNQELQSLIGLSSVKKEVESLTNFIRVQKMREEKGMKTTPISYHCVFTGNPGTGKTTVARIVAKIYKELGILQKGHLVETDRSGLVAEYVGQTAVKTNKIIDSAIDGVLFIDEAYSLVDGSSTDFGKEAIATLLKRMEDNRDRLVVILAGYTEDMKRFIDSNPGLQSRFSRYIEFPDYSAEELFQIFKSCVKKYEYIMTDGALHILAEALQNVIKTKDKNYGNGRYVRNLFEKVIENQANRLSAVENLSANTLAMIEEVDIQSSLS